MLMSTMFAVTGVIIAAASNADLRNNSIEAPVICVSPRM